MRILSGHKGSVRAVAYTPDGRLVTAGEDKTLRIWNALTGETVHTLKGSGPLYAVAVSPDGRKLAYGGRHPPNSESGTLVHLWDLVDNKEAGLHHLPRFRFPRSVWSLSFSFDGSVLAAVGRMLGAGNITAGAGGHWWSAGANGPLADSSAFAVRFAPDRPMLAVTENGRVGFYRDQSATEADVSYKLPVNRPEAVAFMPGTKEAIVVAGKNLFILNTEKVSRKREIKTEFRVVTSVAIAQSGRAAIVVGKPGALELFDIIGGGRIISYDFDLGGVFSVAMSPDGLTVATACEKGVVVIDAEAW